MKIIRGIGIESSCDETSVALVEDGKKILSDPVFSQILLHREFGGVVPEMASRAHLQKIPYLLKTALEPLSDYKSQLDYIAVTTRPGLVGSLLVGYTAALTLGFMIKKPVIPIHHLEAHLYAPLLEGHNMRYPFLGFLISGGNTALFSVERPNKMIKLGDTVDDACGEALDKAAAILGLPYPGGPHIEKAAAAFSEQAMKESTLREIDEKNPLPIILKDQPNSELFFSFSGIKTALLYQIQKIKRNGGDIDEFFQRQYSYYFQKRVFEILRRNMARAIKKYKIKSVVAAGGVLANKTLKKLLSETAEKNGASFISPSPSLCTDNAAMVAALGYVYFKNNIVISNKCVSSKTDFFEQENKSSHENAY